MIAFFVSTPFHIFNCVNLKVSLYPNENAILFIIKNGSTDDSIVENVRKSGIFYDVEYVKEPRNCSSPFLFLKSYLLTDRKKAGHILSETFNELFITRNGPIADFAYTHMLKKNPKLKVNYFEEGLADYLHSPRPDDIKRMRIIYRFGYLDAYTSITHFYLYEPSIRCANLNQPAVPMPKVGEASYAAIKKAFAVDKIDVPDDCKLVYLDQPFKIQLGFDIDDRHILSLIEKVIPHENIYVKLHPGDTDVGRYDGYKKFPSQPYPWEVILGEMDLQNTVFVAVSSTAASSPKAVYGIEAKVIFTNGMFSDTPFLNIEGQRKYFDGLQKLYKDQSRFSMPKSDDEFVQALKKMR